MFPDIKSHKNRLSIKSVTCTSYHHPNFPPQENIIALQITPVQFIIQRTGGPNVIFDLDGIAKGHYKP